MQQLARTSTLGTSYTAAQVTGFLLSQNNQERWLFDKLNSQLQYVADLTPYVDYQKKPPKITHDMANAAKRTLTLQIMGNAPIGEVDFLSAVIRVRYQLKTPDGGWIEWTQGLFTLTPWDQEHYPGWDWHTIICSDFSQFLIDSTFTSAFTANAGDQYVSNIDSIVSGYGGMVNIPINILPAPTVAIPASLTWEVGKTRLQAVNDLLAAINYYPLWFDENGVLNSSPIPDYNTILPSFIFDATQGSSIIMRPITEKPDMSKVYNQVQVIVEDGRRNSFSIIYTNNNPLDPVSIGNWGHIKTLTIRDTRVSDQASAYQRGLIEAQQASRYFKVQTVQTLPWPVSQDHDLYQIIYAPVDEGGLHFHNVVESRWEQTCAAGKPTTHVWEIVAPK